MLSCSVAGSVSGSDVVIAREGAASSTSRQERTRFSRITPTAAAPARPRRRRTRRGARGDVMRGRYSAEGVGQEGGQALQLRDAAAADDGDRSRGSGAGDLEPENVRFGLARVGFIAAREVVERDCGEGLLDRLQALGGERCGSGPVAREALVAAVLEDPIAGAGAVGAD